MIESILPPNSEEIERDVISVMSHNPGLIVTIEDIIHADCFYTPDYRYLFEVMFSIHLSGREVSQSNILTEIVPSGKKHILETYQQVRKYYSDHSALVRNVIYLVELSKKRDALNGAYKVLNLIKGGRGIEEIETEMDKSLNALQNMGGLVSGSQFDQSLDELAALMNKDRSTGISGVPTGVKTLDEITSGWQDEDIVVIAARPGMGKTVSASFHAYHAAKRGIPVAFISLEVSKAKITGRIVSNITGISSSDITKGRLADNQRKIVMRTLSEIRSLPIHYYDNKNSWDVNDICRTMRNWRRKYGIGLVIIDYIQLLQDREVKDAADGTKVLNSVLPKLTKLRSQIGCPIIELSQLTRENESKSDKRPGLHNLKGSGKIEEQATVIIFLYRQDYYDANAARDRGDEFVPTYDMEYIFAKNREGDMGPVLLKCNPAINRLWDISETSHSSISSFERNVALNGLQTSFS